MSYDQSETSSKQQGQNVDEIKDEVLVTKVTKGSTTEDYEEADQEGGAMGPSNVEPVPLSPFEKIKLEADRRTAHGHPVILPTEYGGFGPVYDVFALFQNAIKKQVLVAYNTLEGMIRYKFAMGHAEVRRFFDWFDTFCDSALTFLAVEEEELYPFLENCGAILPIEVTKMERMKMKDKLAVQLQTIDKQRGMFRMLPPGEVVPRITTVLPVFLRSIIDYYDLQAAKLPRVIVELNIEMAKAITLRSRVMRALKTRPNYGMHVIFMSHWLTGTKLRGWKGDFLGPLGTLKYEQWSRKFIQGYQSIPGRLLETLMTETAAGDSTDGSSSNLSFYLNRKKNAYKV